MSSDRNGQKQPGLWDEEIPYPDNPERPGRHPLRATRAPARTMSAGQSRPGTNPPAAQATRPALDLGDLWDADRVAAYLGVPKQTLYAWRHSGKGPKGFRVGRHLHWHARTVVEWTLALERDQ